jgi:hypothetical protein
VFENRVLRIFGSKRKDVAEGWRSLHNEELHDLYASRNITRVVKARRVRWARHLVRMEGMRNTLEDLGIDGRTI